MRRALALLPGLLAFAALAAAPAAAQTTTGKWDTYLSMRTCNDLLVLRDTVWIATGEAGLVHYQPSTGAWGSITREPSGLAGNHVQTIVFDRSGNLFAAVPGKGVSRLDTDGRWSLLNAFDGLPSDTTLVMRAMGDTVWIGTTRGLALWDGTTVAGSVPDLGTPSPFTNNTILGIAITGDSLYVGTPDAIYVARLSQRLGTWTNVTSSIPLTNLEVRGIATDGRTLLALIRGRNQFGGTILSGFRWNPATNSWPTENPEPTGPGQALRRLRDDHGVILATTLAGTHIRATNGTWTLFPNSPNTDNNDVTALEPACFIAPAEPPTLLPDTLVYAGRFGRLLERALPAWNTLVAPGPVGNTCRAIAWSNGTVYASYADEGFSRLRDGVWRNWPNGSTCSGAECDSTFSSTSFSSTVLVDPLGKKWVSFWSGPLSTMQDDVFPPIVQNLFFNSSNADSAHLHYTIHAVAADSTQGAHAGRWFGLDSDRIGGEVGNPLGLDLYAADGTFIRTFGTNYPGLRNGLIRGLACDRSNTMWVGYKGSSAAGLSTFQVPENLSADIVLSDVPGTTTHDVFGLVARGDSIWVLASDNLRRYRQSTRTLVSTLPIAGPVGLLGMHPLAVAPNGTVFVGTTAGLRMHRSGVAAVDFTPENSPLANLEVRALAAEPSGAVWVATAGGIHRFDPDYVPPPEPALPALHVKLYPNPTWLTGAGMVLRLSGEAQAYQGEVMDLTGRIVHRFSVAGNGAAIWDGRDLNGRQVGAGMYFLRVRGGGAEATSRVVVLR